MTLREDLLDIILISVDASIVIGSYLFLIMAAWMMTIFAGVLGLCFLADVIYGMWRAWKKGKTEL